VSTWQGNMERALAERGCADQQEWIDRFPGEHCWFLFGQWPSCAMCGVVQRRDGKNGPCRGMVTIGLRGCR
jgi:hypothetical protein